MRLENKVALISGGARGIGAAITRIFVQEGAKIVIGDILEEEGRRTAEEITSSGGECFFVRLDVTSEADWEQAAGEVMTRFGKLDILVNNAGVSARGNVEETSEADWTRTMDINVKGAFLGSKQAIPLMRTGGGGSIINISSGAGIAPQPGTSGAYAASKGAVISMTHIAALQLGQYDINVNAICPGGFMTEPNQRRAEEKPEVTEKFKGQVPLVKCGEPVVLGPLAVYLASDAARYVTGAAILIDGGYTIW